MAPLLRFAGVMAAQRVVRGWRLEAALFGSILLAVALMSSGVIFSDLLANAALHRALAEAPPEEVNFWARSFSSQDDPPEAEGRRRAFQSRQDFVARQVIAPFRPYLKEHSRYLETATFFFRGHPQLELDRDIRPRGAVYYITGVSGRVRVLAGRWPDSPGVPGQPLDVAVDRLGAELLGLGVGDGMEIFPATSFDDYPPLKARIAAIYERTDSSDEFWQGLDSAASRKDDRWTLIPLFAAEDALIEQALGAYPSLYADITWRFFPDKANMRAGDVAEAQIILAGIERSISGGLKNSSYSIRLDTLLRRFEEQLLLGRLPLFMALFLVTGILVYYLALVAGLVVRSRAGEIAMLKSRGATVWQLGVLGLGEGLLLALPAMIAGPFLALGAVKLLGAAFFELSGASGDWAGVPAGLSGYAFLVGISGGGLSAAVFAGATLAAARRSSVAALQAAARPPAVSLLHRYYLDLALLALIGLLWWQLQSRGAFLVQSLGGRELSIDYSLLLGPVLGMAAAGLLTLRFFPWAAAALARLAAPVGPPWLVHALRHLARDPMAPALLVVLVMMATALGVMGSAFSATLELGQRQQALYAAGADLRLRHGGWDGPGGLAAHISDANSISGAGAAADVFRSPAYLTTTGFSTSGTLLAVDADAIAKVAWFRDDFAGGRSLQSLSHLLRGGATGDLPAPDADGIPIPLDATALSLWARPGGSGRGVGLWARLRDSQGRITDAGMGNLDNTGWSRLRLDLSSAGLGDDSFGRRPGPELQPPFDLISFSVRNRFRESDGGAVFLGRAEAATPGGDVLLHNFQSAEGWAAIADFRRPGLYSLETSQSAAADGFGVTSRFSWASGGVGLTGLRAGGPDTPIPALVSSQFLDVTDAAVGDTIVLSMSTYALPLRVAAEVEYFPTLDPDGRPFAVVDLARFTQAAVRYSPQQPGGANELWVDFEDVGNSEAPPESGQVSAALRDAGVNVREVLLSPSMAAARLERPLVNAGWGALLVLLFLAIALASASGLLLFSHLDARERRTEFALLRTLGLSRGQMQLVPGCGLALMVGGGIGLGTLLGWLMGSSLLPLMEVVEGGARATPPLAFTTDWGRLLVSYAILAGVAGACGVWLAWATGKLSLQQVMRMGE